MSEIVIILGAGASKQAGAPLMADFLDRAADLYWSDKLSAADSRHFKRVFDAIGGLQKVHSKAQLNLTNLESVFTTLELSAIIKKLPGVEASDIPEVVASLRHLIVVTLQENVQFFVNKKIEAPAPYPRLMEALGKINLGRKHEYSVSIITFNYDLCIDLAMAYSGRGPDYIFAKSPGESSRNQTQLMKLHGSMNWASTADGEIKLVPVKDFLARFPIDDHFEQAYHKLKIGTRLLDYFTAAKPGTIVAPEPVIVPPSWNKSDYHRSLSEIWKAAAANLSEARFIYIIGYSLPETDAFFRLLYALGSVGENPLARLTVFNPDPAVAERFRSILGPGAIERYSFKPMKFDEAVTQIRQDFDQP